MEERQIPDFFKCPKNYSNKWNEAAFVNVSEWITKELNKCGIGAPQTVKEWALDSRGYGNILPDRNNQPVRYILSILYQKGYVDFIDDLTFCLKKRIK
ncbi:MAG: hypothetical protein KKD50_05160 [Proteobacteria bacterium]|nr:hypothetical protein [Pseudomonadota bacterium]